MRGFWLLPTRLRQLCDLLPRGSRFEFRITVGCRATVARTLLRQALPCTAAADGVHKPRAADETSAFALCRANFVQRLGARKRPFPPAPIVESCGGNNKA